MTVSDLWNQPVSGQAASVSAWDAAWRAFLHFRNDPIATLSDANESDDRFLLGPAFCVIYRVLAGAPEDLGDLRMELAWVRDRAEAVPERERTFAGAAELVAAGDFTAAAHYLDERTATTLDMAAVRVAHDLYLHVGDAPGRLRSSRAAVDRWSPDDAGYGALLGQYSFALEEAGHYPEAEEIGLQALAIDSEDLWARHALAHVYESTNAQAQALALLRDTSDQWADQDLLAVHVWWHLALRLLWAGEIDEVLAIYDSLVPDATTAFRLCDLTSLLWRTELVTGLDLGERWDLLADRWAERPERHTCAFLDVHAALAFTRRADHRGAGIWWQGLAERTERTDSENDRIFADVVRPLVDAARAYGDQEYEEVVAIVDSLGTGTQRIGGSVAQRDIIVMTCEDARLRIDDDGPANPGGDSP